MLKEKRREELDKKLSDKLARERAELETTVKKEQEDKRERITRDRKNEEERRIANANARKIAHISHLSNFLATKPSEGISVLYLPAVHNDRTRELLAERKAEMAKEAAKVGAELADVDVPARPKIAVVEKSGEKKKSDDLPAKETEPVKDADMDEASAEKDSAPAKAEKDSAPEPEPEPEPEENKDDYEMPLDRDGDDDAVEY